MKRLGSIGLGLVGLTLVLVCGTCFAGTPGLHLAKRATLKAGAPVRALAFGPGGHHAYLARDNELLAYDTATAQSEENLNLHGPIVDLAMDPAHAKGYALLASPVRLVSFGLQPLRLLRQQKLDGGTGLLYDGRIDAVFVENAQDATLAKFNAASGHHLGTLHLSGTLGQMAIDQRGTLYVADSVHDAIDAVDEAHMTALDAIPLSGCKGPSGLAMDPVGRRLFVGCADGMRAVVDTDMGFTFEELPSSLRGASRMVFAFHPFGADGWKGAAIGVGANGQLALIRMLAFVKYVAAGDDTLPGDCEAMALNPTTHQLWLAVGEKSVDTDGANGAVELWMLGQATGATP